MGLLLCFLPIFAGLLIFTFGFKIKFSHQLIACLLGLVAVLPISFLQYCLPDLPLLKEYPVLRSLITSVVVYGFIEEFFKTIVIIPLPHKDYSVKNFLILSFVMALSLACFESSVYYFEHLQSATSKGAQLIYSQIFVRIFSSDIIHMMCTGLCGLFIYSHRNKNRKPSIFIIAVLIHGIYDFFAGFQNNLRFFAIAVILLAISQCRIKYRALSTEEE